MKKRLISLLLVFVFTVQLPFLGYEKGKVYATGAVAGAAGAFGAVGAGSAFWPVTITALAAAGICIGIDKAVDKIEDMTAEEQKEYYNTVAANNKEAIKKLYDDGYFANTGMEEVIGNMLSGDDTACAVSLKKVLKDKEMEEGKDIKTYESGKKDDNGKNKPLVAVSGRLLDLLVDVIGGAVGNMIEDKQSSSSGSDDDEVLIKALSTLPTAEQAEKDFERTPYSNYILFKAAPTMDNGVNTSIVKTTSDAGYYMLWYNNIKRSSSYDMLEYYGYVSKPYKDRGSAYMSIQFSSRDSYGILYRYNTSSGVWEIVTTRSGPGTTYGVPGLLIYDCRENFQIKFNSQNLTIWRFTELTSPYGDRYYDTVSANPLPDLSTTQPPSVTQIVNNYFGDEITNFYEDVYNYTTNNSNNNYFTENKYLLPTDPADVAKDIIVPAETTINNTYNNISPDVTVDQDYINNVVIPAIIAGIKLNTDVNMGDLTIDNVFDFSGDDPDDETFNKVTFYGLEKKFPFCLPFDIYYFLDALDAEPRAPAFTIVIPLHNFGFEDYSLKIDFSQFDPVFKVVRGCELFLACFGLVFITKKMIWK